MSTCAQCGQSLPDDAQHCFRCGARVASTTGPTQVSQAGPLPRRSPEELANYLTAETPEPAVSPLLETAPTMPVAAHHYPRAATKPPFLASRTEWRAMNPVEPWAQLLPTLMAVMGALLLVAFVAPWTMPAGGELGFAWHAIEAADSLWLQILPILGAVTGVLVLVLGILPVGTGSRALAAAGAATLLALLGVGVEAAQLESFSTIDGWRFAAVLGGVLLMPVGLVLRSRYPASLASRLVVSLGAAAVLSAYVVPSDDQVPLFSLFQGPPEESGSLWEIGVRLLLVGPFLLAALAPMVWLPATFVRGAEMHAWGLIVWLPLAHVGMAFADAARTGEWTEALRTPGVSLVPGLVAFATAVLLAYGGAQVIAKNLEPRSRPESASA